MPEASPTKRPRTTQLRRYEVRTNCEYVIEIEVSSAEEALAKAEKIDTAEWDQAWAEMEAEPVAEE
jgi:hypothetical protein